MVLSPTPGRIAGTLDLGPSRPLSPFVKAAHWDQTRTNIYLPGIRAGQPNSLRDEATLSIARCGSGSGGASSSASLVVRNSEFNSRMSKPASSRSILTPSFPSVPAQECPSPTNFLHGSDCQKVCTAGFAPRSACLQHEREPRSNQAAALPASGYIRPQ